MFDNKLEFLKFHNDASFDYEELLKKVVLEDKNGVSGYYRLCYFDSNLDFEIEQFLKDKKYKYIVLIGVGGSSLGVKAVCNAVEFTPNAKIYFIDNMDGYNAKEVFDSIIFDDTVFIICSKSGSTIEVLSFLKLIIFRFKVEDFSKNFIFITESGSNLQKFANSKQAKCFCINKNIGGRFSVLSAVGMVAFKIIGINTYHLCKGAMACHDDFFIKKSSTIIQKAKIYSMLDKKINILFSYSQKLQFFNEWYIQLWAESLGKDINSRTPISLIGSKDQHSFLQLIMDGKNDKTVTFIKVKKSLQDFKFPDIKLEFLKDYDYSSGISINDMLCFQCDATIKATLDKQIYVDTIEIDRIDEFNIGYLIYYFELLTSCMGILLNINTYNQPAVEVGKKILKYKILDNKNY